MKRQIGSLFTKFLVLVFVAGLVLTGCSTEIGGSGGSGSETTGETGGSPSSGYYTITYVDENGTTLKTQTVYSGTYGVNFNYSKEGYKTTFTNANGIEVSPNGYLVNSDMTLTVHNTPITYKIKFEKGTYDSRTITGTFPEEMICTYDKEYTLPANTLTCKRSSDNYLAAGWTTNSNYVNSKGEYSDGAKVKNLSKKDGETVSLYACFSNNDAITLTFYISDYSKKIVYAKEGDILDASVVIPQASAIGMVFKGYYLSSDSTETLIDFTTYKVTGSKTFKPKFEPGKFKATFVSEHGTVPKSVEWTYSSKYTVVADLETSSYVLTEKGVKFEGWYNGSKKVKKLYSDEYSDLTLTAEWSPWKAGILFNNNNPAGVSEYSGSMNSQTLIYDTPADINKNTIVAKGYKFTGWNTKKDGSGTAYADGASITWKGEKNSETIILYAQWEPLSIGVSIALLNPETKSDITLTYNATAESFTAKLTGATSYSWYIDGKKLEGETGSRLSAYALSLGQHTVMVTSDFNGRTYGTTLLVNVSEKTEEE